MIQRGSELLRINTQKNDIEYSKEVGVLGIGDIQVAIQEHTSIYLIWNLRF